MKISQTTTTFLALVLQAQFNLGVSALDGQKNGIRGAHQVQQQDLGLEDRQLKSKKNGGGGGGSSGGGSTALSDHVTLTTASNGKQYALLDPTSFSSANSKNENNNNGGGVLERHSCVSHEQALAFNKLYSAQNTANDETCVSSPDSCSGCCRVGYALWCDSKNSFPQLPCICNARTRDPESWKEAPEAVVDTTEDLIAVVETELASFDPTFEATTEPAEEDIRLEDMTVAPTV
jgi:hypothetical protein